MDGGVKTLLSIDPGKVCSYAVFVDGVLRDCAYRDPDATWDPDVVVVEIPQVYQQRKQKGNPNDLVQLAFTAGLALRHISYVNEPSLETIRPRAWKGTRPKHVCNKITLNALTEEEKARIPDLPKTKLHNVLDAIGIGLWRLGRR